MKEIRLNVPLTPEQVKDRLETAFPVPAIGAPEFVRTADRMFCHVKPSISKRSVLRGNGSGIDPTFVELHLKALGNKTQITISPMTSGFLLAGKILVITGLWIIAPILAVHQEGWGIVPKMLLACTLITLLLWWLQRLLLKDERQIVNRIIKAFPEADIVLAKKANVPASAGERPRMQQ